MTNADVAYAARFLLGSYADWQSAYEKGERYLLPFVLVV